jgi:hypothetical protein
MDFGYNQVQAANLAPYLEMMQKQQQQPMIDALNRQKLQEGMLNMGSLEYKARKEQQDESDRKNALATLQNYIVDKPSLNGKFYDDNGKPITADTPGMELRKSLDKGGYTTEGIKQGYDPRILAEIMKGVGDASGMNMEEKQGNVLETLLMKQMANGNKSDLAEEKLKRMMTKDPLKDAEAATLGVSTDWIGTADRDAAKQQVYEQLLSAQDNPDRYKQVQQSAVGAIQKPAETLDYLFAGLDAAGLAASIPSGGTSAVGAQGAKKGLLAALKTPTGKKIAQGLGLGSVVGQLNRSDYGSVFGDKDFNSEKFIKALTANQE